MTNAAAAAALSLSPRTFLELFLTACVSLMDQKFDDPLDKDIHTDSEDSDDEGMSHF